MASVSKDNLTLMRDRFNQEGISLELNLRRKKEDVADAEAALNRNTGILSLIMKLIEDLEAAEKIEKGEKELDSEVVSMPSPIDKSEENAE